MRGVKRSFIAIITSAVMIIMCMPHAYAAERPIAVYLDGKLINFGITNGQQVQALTLYDYAYVPVAKIVETLTGRAPDWDNTTKTATYVYNGRSYRIDTRQSGIYIDGTFRSSITGTPPVIVNDRTLIPLKMLTNAMNFSQRYEASTHTVWLTTPVAPAITPSPTISPTAANVISVSANKTSIQSGETVTITVRANGVTTMAKIMDAKGNTLAEAKSYRSDGSDNVFTLDIKPTSSVKLQVYAGTSSYSSNYKELNISVNTASLTIDSVTPSSTNPARGNTINITMVTSTNTTRVWLNHSSKGNFLTTSTGYTDSGGKRTWKLYYTVDLDNFQNYRAYASDSVGNTISSDFYLDITPNANAQPIIQEAYASPSEIEINASTGIYVVTNTDVTSLTYSMSSGSGSLKDTKSTGYSDANGRRYWNENIFYAGSSTGTSRITVTAVSATGATVNSTVTITVKSSASSDTRVYGASQITSDPIYPGQSVEYSITTGLGVTSVTCRVNNGSETRAQWTNESTDRSYFRITVTAPSTEGNYTVSFYGADDSGYQSSSTSLTMSVVSSTYY